MSSFLSDFFGPTITKIASVLYPKRPVMNYVGANGIDITAADDLVNNQTTLTIDGTGAGGGGGLPTGPTAMPGWFNVKFYGAKGDATYAAVGTGTDDSAAFQAAISAMSASGNSQGGVLYIPPGNYRLAKNVHICKQLRLTGLSGVSSNALATINFDAGAQFIVWSTTGSGFSCVGADSEIENLDIFTNPITTTMWTGTHAYNQGDNRISPGSNWAYLHCLKAGTSGGSPPAPPYSADLSTEFVPNGFYTNGQLVYGTTDQAPLNGTGSNLITSALFVVTTPAVLVAAAPAGNTRPVFDTTLGHTTVSGSVTFTAIDPSAYWVTDGGVTWSCRVHAGILALGRVAIRDVSISDATNAGVMIRGNSGDTPGSNADNWHLQRVRANQCGIGFMTAGSDSNTGLGELLDVESAGFHFAGTNGGVGIYEHSQLGNCWIACQVANLDADGGGAAYYAPNGAANCFIRPYSEPSGGALGKSLFAYPSVVIAPTFGAGLDLSSTATVISGVDQPGGRNITCQTLDPTSAKLYTYMGRQDGSSTFSASHALEDYVNIPGYTNAPSSYVGLPKSWWSYGKGTAAAQQAFAFPGEGSTWFSGVPVSVVSAADCAGRVFHVTQNRIHIGASGADPPAVGFASTVPTSGHWIKGSVVYNTTATVGQPTGWMCTASTTYSNIPLGIVNTQATWQALANL